MRYYWLRDRKAQQQFQFFWDKGTNNEADYFTKHWATIIHRLKRNKYVKDKLMFLSQVPNHMDCEGVLKC